MPGISPAFASTLYLLLLSCLHVLDLVKFLVCCFEGGFCVLTDFFQVLAGFTKRFGRCDLPCSVSRALIINLALLKLLELCMPHRLGEYLSSGPVYSRAPLQDEVYCIRKTTRVGCRASTGLQATPAGSTDANSRKATTYFLFRKKRNAFAKV